MKDTRENKEKIIDEARKEVEYCQRKFKLALAKLETMASDEGFGVNDVYFEIMELTVISEQRAQFFKEMQDNINSDE